MHAIHIGTAAIKLGWYFAAATVVAATELADVLPTVITDTSKIGLLTVAAWQVLREIKKSANDRLTANDTALAVYQRLATEADDRADEAEERLRTERLQWADTRNELERTIQHLKGSQP